MSEHLDQWLDRMRAQPPPTPFAPAEAVRRRGRRRTYRRYGLSAVAGLATVGLAVTGLGQLPGNPAITPPPAAGPMVPAVDPLAPTTGAPPTTGTYVDRLIDDSWFLTTADLGPGDWQELGPVTRYVDGPPNWLWAVTCAGFKPGDHPSLALRRDLALHSWGIVGEPSRAEELARRDWGSHDLPPAGWRLRLAQAVDLFQPGGARQNLADIRRVVEECDPASWDDDPVRYQLVRTGFAGDESLLITETRQDSVSLIAVVRVGEVVTTLRSYGPLPEDDRMDHDRLAALAQAAAARLSLI